MTDEQVFDLGLGVEDLTIEEVEAIEERSDYAIRAPAARRTP